ncbi:MAG: hypothetical protein WAX69_13175 [Victivallales bacterium]
MCYGRNNIEILSYGEDALTLWALSSPTRLKMILANDDNSELGECKIFYRPSFGRGGRGKEYNFGEFDFIIVSKNNVYLGESKWYNSPEYAKSQNQITLKEPQDERFTIFNQYIKEWKTISKKEKRDYGFKECWDEFKENHCSNNIKKKVPDSKKTLAHNLWGVLKEIISQEVKPVTLFFSKPDSNKADKIQGSGVIVISAPSLCPKKEPYFSLLGNL